MSLFGEVSDGCRASIVGESGGEPEAVRRQIVPALHMSTGRDGILITEEYEVTASIAVHRQTLAVLFRTHGLNVGRLLWLVAMINFNTPILPDKYGLMSISIS